MSKFIEQILKIDRKVDLDNEFPDWNKSVQFNAHNGYSFYFTVNKGKVDAGEGKIDAPDVVIEGDEQSLMELFDGSLSVIGGFITKKLRINGKMGDALGANVLVQAARIF